MMAWHRQALGETAVVPCRLPAAPGDPILAIASAAAATISVVWAFGWLTILLRRATGGFSDSPGIAMPWLTVLVGLAVVAMMDGARRAGMAPPWTSLSARAGTVIAVLAVIPVGGTAAEQFASIIPLGMAVAGGLVSPLVAYRNGWHRRHSSQGSFRTTATATASRVMPVVITSASPPQASGFRQRLERFQTATEGDRAIGRVIVDVPTGSRTGHAHVGFCPPFLAMPTVEVMSDDDGIEAVVTAAEVVPWGVRVECRLSEPAEEPLAIPVDILARYAG